MSLTEIIKKKRPNLKDISIKQYTKSLNKLKELFESDNFEFLKEPNEVMEKLSNLHFTTIRNTLNAVIVYLLAVDGDEDIIKTYTEKRDELNKQYDQEQEKGVISDKQKKNFASKEELNGMIEQMNNELKPIRKKEELSKKENALLQVYTIFNIYMKMPFRNDVSNMDAIKQGAFNKLSKEERESKNYLVINKNQLYFILNNYKTQSKYEELKLDIEDKELKKILFYYLKRNGEGRLFKSQAGTPLTSNALSQLLLKTSKKYIGKSVSTTLLRKIYLSDKYADTKEEMKNDAKMMAHSVATQQKVYVKKGK
tara:strand:+ start:676 stop:1608 length:933 start_codon:yes stop_codon:yes gene_type:complete